jgi:hypothetical protein
LILQSSISNIRHPRKRVLAVFQDWFSGDSQGKPAILSGCAATMLDDPRDLVAFRTPVDEDVLSKALQDHWPFPVDTIPDLTAASLTVEQGSWVRHRDYIPFPRTPCHDCGCSDQRHYLSCSASRGHCESLHSPGAQISPSHDRRLYSTVCYVTLMTNARRAEVFAAAAAYAAVLVVFVWGNLG